jgi:RES domain-containing protein
MRVWRIAASAYDPLDGEGARRFGGRWSSPGQPVVYTAEHLSLAALEVLVHTDPDLLPLDLAAFEIEVPDGLSVARVPLAALPDDWKDLPAHPACRAIGDRWLAAGEAPLLAVPSAIIPVETNYLIASTEAAGSGVRVVDVRPFSFDGRLLRRAGEG